MIRTNPGVSMTDSPAAATWARPLPELGWMAVLAVAILFVSGSVIVDFAAASKRDNVAVIAIWSLLYLCVGLLMVRQAGKEWLVWSLRHLPLLCLLLAIALASSLWSVDPMLSMRRAISLAGSTLLGIFIGYLFPPRIVMRIVFWFLATALAANVLIALVSPEIGIDLEGNWQGITLTRNHLGFLSAVAATFFLVGTVGRRIDPVWGWPLLGLAILTLAMTRSATAIVALATGVAVVMCFLVSKRLRFPSLAVLLVLILGLGYAAFLATLALEQFTSLLGRDPTFTNRTIIWADALRIVGERPLTGYGYQAVWGFGAESWLPHIPSTTDWAGHAHNGFLQIATELGLPAAILATLYLLYTMLQSADAFVRRASPFALFAISFMFMILVENITEAWFLRAQNASWILFVALSAALARTFEHHGRKKRRRRSRRRRRGTAAVTAAIAQGHDSIHLGPSDPDATGHDHARASRGSPE